jgi:hypothetical protein
MDAAPTDHLELNAIAVYQLIVWALSGAIEREQVLAATPEPEQQRLAWERNALARVAAAVDWYFHAYHSDFRSSVQVHRFGLVKDGPDPAGVVMLSAQLEQLVRYWQTRADENGASRLEAHARLNICRSASEVFHQRLGASPEQLRICAAQMNLDEDNRSGRYVQWKPDGSLEVVRPDGPHTCEEEKAEERIRMEAAQREWEAKWKSKP